MAAPNYVLSLAAQRDLADLFNWIAGETGPYAAAGALRRIAQKLEILAAMPRIGRVRDDLDGAPRTFAVWPWIIFYTPVEEGSGVLVFGFWMADATFRVDSYTRTIRLPRFSPASRPIRAAGRVSRPSMMSSVTFSRPSATQACRSARACSR